MAAARNGPQPPLPSGQYGGVRRATVARGGEAECGLVRGVAEWGQQLDGRRRPQRWRDGRRRPPRWRGRRRPRAALTPATRSSTRPAEPGDWARRPLSRQGQKKKCTRPPHTGGAEGGPRGSPPPTTEHSSTAPRKGHSASGTAAEGVDQSRLPPSQGRPSPLSAAARRDTQKKFHTTRQGALAPRHGHRCGVSTLIVIN